MPNCSTQRNTVRYAPLIEHVHAMHLQTRLFLPCCNSRLAEGGLRTKGIFKAQHPTQPLLSIITVVFNGQNHIEQAIQSVMNQNWSNVEYIVIDGGSTDKTIDILQSYDDRIDYWVSEKDHGISDAFNKGISCATGQFIGLINADDWYEPETLESVALAYLDDPEVGVICGRIQYWKQGQKDFEYESDPSRLHLEMTVNHPTCFISRATYQRHGGFLDHFKCAMDYELMLRLYAGGIKFKSLERVMANMRLDGTSDKYWRRSLAESRQAKIKHLGHPIRAWWYWSFQLLRRIIRDIFLRVGLFKLVSFYRTHFSILAKHKRQ